MEIDPLSRRRVLAGTAALAAGSLAGCTEQLTADAGDGGPSVAASFFVVGDFARAVAGDEATVNTLVPVGQHGHGWEPSARIQRDARQADLFVRVGEGFQPWADDLAASVEGDGADVAVASANVDVDLLSAEHQNDEHDGGDGDEHDGGDGTAHEEGDHEEGDHDHGRPDPHFWLDPTRAATAVRTIATAVGDLDGVDADRVAANADAYVDDLRALDESFASALGDAERNVVLVAGHDAYGYLGARYGFEVHALRGLAPGDQPSPADVREAQSVVETHDVDHVLTPVFESDRAATELVRETAASDTLPITAIPGESEAWAEEDWGYLDVMREVNLPSLREALSA